MKLATADRQQRGFEVYGSLSPNRTAYWVAHKNSEYRSINVVVVSVPLDRSRANDMQRSVFPAITRAITNPIRPTSRSTIP
jgi:hypothetical protein